MHFARLFTLITTIALSVGALGQRRGDYYLQFEHSWGTSLNNYFLSDLAEREGYKYNSSQFYYPPSGATIARFFSSRWSLTFSYSLHFVQYWSDFDTGEQGRADWLLFTVATGFRYMWHDIGQLYQFVELSLGYTHGDVDLINWPVSSSKPSNVSLPAFHVTVIGSRVGKKYGLEYGIGYGYKGIINLGFFFAAQLIQTHVII